MSASRTANRRRTSPGSRRSPYLDAVYADVDGVDLQVVAKEAGTDIVVEETVRSIGTLVSGKTAKEEITLTLENGRGGYDIWVTIWQDGRMRESGSVNVFLPPDRTVATQRLAYSLLTVSAIDVMTPPDLDATRSRSTSSPRLRTAAVLPGTS
ncbi:hypothetical protein [Methanoculleus chikugoensis]|uniref:DUF7490 domain-containing protein n=1 Tax=Methanoculleus chikugoensis TaxID=118126 RepID=UPI0006D0C572|nr:hypothetical protein [Methanoculleus chikugoensis]